MERNLKLTKKLIATTGWLLRKRSDSVFIVMWNSLVVPGGKFDSLWKFKDATE